jgi:hypothetical protein
VLPVGFKYDVNDDISRSPVCHRDRSIPNFDFILKVSLMTLSSPIEGSVMLFLLGAALHLFATTCALQTVLEITEGKRLTLPDVRNAVMGIHMPGSMRHRTPTERPLATTAPGLAARKTGGHQPGQVRT